MYTLRLLNRLNEQVMAEQLAAIEVRNAETDDIVLEAQCSAPRGSGGQRVDVSVAVRIDDLDRDQVEAIVGPLVTACDLFVTTDELDYMESLDPA